MKYFCKNCSRGFEKKIDKCYFCGMDSIEREKDAEELVGEVEELLKG